MNILHVDMDAFFASVEIARDPSLRGKPVIIAGLGPRGVVAAASYEAREYGVHSALPTAVARRRCPRGVFMKPTASYGAVSRSVMAIFREYTPHVQPISVDEAFLDVAGARRMIGTPAQIARTIRARVRDEHGITCTVGIASTKFLAKLASEHAKPDGLGIVPRETELRFLHPLPIRSVWGIGEKTAQKLGRLGMRTVGDIARLSVDRLAASVGTASAEHLHALARNIDPRPVRPERVEKSISNETTFGHDAPDASIWGPTLLELSRKVASRARTRGLAGRGVTVKLRFGDFKTITRSRMLPAPTDVGQEIHAAARELADEAATAPVRLIGVRLDHLVEYAAVGRQVALDEPDRGWREIEAAIDDAAARFGKDSIRSGGRLRRSES
ncbi:DNA polymerase IV [Glycomyces xiaoerkulensis]|uniref:DNA polymerase IV n=1 Tax=Glycomyces xiaoerkulensis TaxID=2038139 RepID=UPI001E58079D|nr:DNA polymerase IV [Glycomyces xiaoerkulensis]